MNDLIPIKVVCHAGYKSDEYPKYFYWENLRFDIKEIYDRWYQNDLNPDFSEANYFKILTDSGKTYLLKHVIKSDSWFLFTRGESLNL